MIQSLCVYCGSNTGADPVFADAARATGAYLGANGYRLVYGGGQVGLMGLLANSAIDAGGTVTGVIPDFLHHKEIAHPRVADMRIVTSMHERKQIMAEEADAFLALPGGIGTMEELFEIWTWAQLGRHEKPVAILNVESYFDGLMRFLDEMTGQGFLEDKHRKMLIEDTTIEAVLDRLNAFEYPGTIASLTRAQT